MSTYIHILSTQEHNLSNMKVFFFLFFTRNCIRKRWFWSCWRKIIPPPFSLISKTQYLQVSLKLKLPSFLIMTLVGVTHWTHDGLYNSWGCKTYGQGKKKKLKAMPVLTNAISNTQYFSRHLPKYLQRGKMRYFKDMSPKLQYKELF